MFRCGVHPGDLSERLRREEHEFKSSLGYIAKLSQGKEEMEETGREKGREKSP